VSWFKPSGAFYCLFVSAIILALGGGDGKKDAHQASSLELPKQHGPTAIYHVTITWCLPL